MKIERLSEHSERNCSTFLADAHLAKMCYNMLEHRGHFIFPCCTDSLNEYYHDLIQDVCSRIMRPKYTPKPARNVRKNLAAMIAQVKVDIKAEKERLKTMNESFSLEIR